MSAPTDESVGAFLWRESDPVMSRESEPKLCIWLDFGPLISYIA